MLEGSRVKWFTDSQVAAKIVEVGSMKLGLHKMARRIFDICIRSGIHLEVQWIPRTSNQQADYISRLIDTDDWQITEEFFLFLDDLWGPHSVDCFANDYNHKIPTYFSRFWNPNSSGVDFVLSVSSCNVVILLAAHNSFLFFQGERSRALGWKALLPESRNYLSKRRR